MCDVAARIRAIGCWGAGAFLVAGLTFLPTDAWGCAVCIGWGGSGADRGYFWSWLLLTTLPFALVAVIGAWIRRVLRRPPERRGPSEAPAD